MSRYAVTMIGMGEGGCTTLSSLAANRIASADILIGSERLLKFFPQFTGRKVSFKNHLKEIIDELESLTYENKVCLLLSGDPLFFGAGKLIIDRIGKEHIESIPHPSSIQLAFSAIKESWQDAALWSLHGRPLKGLVARMKNRRKIALLTDHHNHPGAIARHLRQFSESDWQIYICENLGGCDEKITPWDIGPLSESDTIFSPLNLMILIRKSQTWRPPCQIPFYRDDAYAQKICDQGLITKKEVRLIALAQLGIRLDSVVWDIGAGSGAIAVEAAFLATEGEVYAIESNPEHFKICQQNVLSCGMDHVTLVHGVAPTALKDLKDPDAVFVGGSKGYLDEIIHTAYERLKAGGTLVATAVTIDTVSLIFSLFKKMGLIPDVTLLNISRAMPLGSYLSYKALNPIHIYRVQKPDPSMVQPFMEKQ